MDKTDTPRRQKSLVPLFFLVLIFALPPLLGWVFFMNPDWLPGNTINSGTLIHPARPVDSLTLSGDDGKPLLWDELGNSWTLTVISQGECNESCRSKLIEVRQLRRALAAARTRVARLLILLPDRTGRMPQAPQAAELEGTIIAKVLPDSLESLRSIFDLDQISSDDFIFVIDPRRSLMMRHNVTTLQPKAILKDLEMLLKASENWVKGEQ